MINWFRNLLTLFSKYRNNQLDESFNNAERIPDETW